MFHDRNEAGMLLASLLRKYENSPGIILAVPRGGVPVAYEVAKDLNLPLELILVKKLGHPANKEYAIGAVGLIESFIVPQPDVSDEYIKSEVQKIRYRLKEMKEKFIGNQKPQTVQDKTVIVIDDGIATGNTLLATIKILKKNKPAKIVIAVPVISHAASEKLLPEVDELVYILKPETLNNIGQFYRNFKQVTDKEIMVYLKSLEEEKTPVY